MDGWVEGETQRCIGGWVDGWSKTESDCYGLTEECTRERGTRKNLILGERKTTLQ
jgi:hypothetical protein